MPIRVPFQPTLGSELSLSQSSLKPPEDKMDKYVPFKSKTIHQLINSPSSEKVFVCWKHWLPVA